MTHPLAVRLGRIIVPDARDWSIPRMLAAAAVPEAVLGETLQTVLETTTYLSRWSDYLLLWRFLKSHQPKPGPIPAPSADAPAWVDAAVLDQGDAGTCVGNGWAGWGDATPVIDTYDEKAARAIYYEATVFDGAPDNPDAPGGGQQGASVRSGAKAMQKRGRLSAYAFARNMAEVDAWIDGHGPVVIGSDWTNDMFAPDVRGFVRPTGAVAGGHCYVMLDRLVAEDAYLFRNSWGKAWGLGGSFYMSHADVDALVFGSGSGEACVALELPQATG